MKCYMVLNGLLVTHRLGSAKIADRVIVMEKGKIAIMLSFMFLELQFYPGKVGRAERIIRREISRVY